MKSTEAFTRRDPGAERPAADGSSLARGLGVLSLGLGLTEIAAPRTLARLIGIKPSPRALFALRAFGMREVVAGVGVLLQPQRSLPLWARLVGDALDMAAIGWAAKTQRTRTERIAAACATVAGVAVLDAIAARRVGRAHRKVIDPVIFSVTINKPPQEVYDFWRKLENLPVFMDYLQSVTELGGGRSHWVAKGPVGPIAWDAEIVDERPGERIAWRTVEGSHFSHTGEVTFARAPGRDMTEVRVKLALGVLDREPSALLGKLLTKPQIKGDLRRLKQVLETGEVMRSDASVYQRLHPAQPPAKRIEPLPHIDGEYTAQPAQTTAQSQPLPVLGADKGGV